MANERPPHSREEEHHELLPWYVAGTLEEEQAEVFRSHIAGCDGCRERMKFFEALRSELDLHGEAFLADHPSPDQLFSLAQRELTDDDALPILRHLALCATCSAEMGWITGKAVARVPAAAATRRRMRRAWIPWGVAAAAALAGWLLPPPWRLSTAESRDPAPLWAVHVPGTERAGGGATAIELPPGRQRFLLVIDADLDLRAFPARLEILDSAGRTVVQSSVTADLLYGGTFLMVPCDRRTFPDGAYRLRLTPSGSPARDYPFQISGLSRGP